ncbi:type II toxin-antitoxin system RelE/ParE family toxin [Nitrospinae bacterium AH_259_B05_G02_I21]|nr:type II toxin-antitoxin system RelE/ParE family toxin [Nitrospinae bacterium AH_259_B05_G02_I21]MDA2932222.1 type II toxin-antitoxin system RelE/ParE family toxin [Nitrospinae bacterium AH-259-F20]
MRKRYEVGVSREVVKALRRFPKEARGGIQKAIEDLAGSPRPRGCKKLDEDIYRIRVGRDYRVIYAINDEEKTVSILKASTREGAY